MIGSRVGAGVVAGGLVAAGLVACSPADGPRRAARQAQPPSAAQTSALAASASAPDAQAPAAPSGLSPRAVNAARFSGADSATSPPPGQRPPPDPVMIRAEVLLARSRFSPGVIDGEPGDNERRALAAFQAKAGLPPTGALDTASWAALTRDAAPVLQAYTITAADVAGPFAADDGEDFVKLAALPDGPRYSSAEEAIADRFEMDPALLEALNPGAEFDQSGTRLVVAAPFAPPLRKGEVARIEASKADEQVTAFDRNGDVLAAYPATVGSTERPSPSGVRKVTGVAFNPKYVFDPAKHDWGPHGHGALVIKPGPKGPVGLVWIELNAPGYGIHGAPDPAKVGKTASHGCVRLTNWDALALAHGVRPGVTVTFVGARPPD